MQIHPAALLFPVLTDKEYKALSTSIGIFGQKRAILTFEGKILDGRGRFQACLTNGVEPRFMEYVGNEPYKAVVFHNLRDRSYLTQSQKAAIAVDFRGPLMDEAKRSGEAPPHEGRTAELAADTFGISHSQVKRAGAIQALSPEVFEQVKAGEITVGKAGSILGASDLRTTRGKRKHPARYYGKGDKWDEAVTPLRRYLNAAAKRDYAFTLVNTKEAAHRVYFIDQLIADLLLARADLEARSQSAKLTAGREI